MSKRTSVRNHSFKNEFRLQVHFHAHQSHLHMKCFSRGILLEQRHKVPRTWRIQESTDLQRIASYADALWARHAIFLRDEPKERLCRRLFNAPLRNERVLEKTMVYSKNSENRDKYTVYLIKSRHTIISCSYGCLEAAEVVAYKINHKTLLNQWKCKRFQK